MDGKSIIPRVTCCCIDPIDGKAQIAIWRVPLTSVVRIAVFSILPQRFPGPPIMRNACSETRRAAHLTAIENRRPEVLRALHNRAGRRCHTTRLIQSARGQRYQNDNRRAVTPITRKGPRSLGFQIREPIVISVAQRAAVTTTNSRRPHSPTWSKKCGTRARHPNSSRTAASLSSTLPCFKTSTGRDCGAPDDLSPYL